MILTRVRTRLPIALWHTGPSEPLQRSVAVDEWHASALCGRG